MQLDLKVWAGGRRQLAELQQAFHLHNQGAVSCKGWSTLFTSYPSDVCVHEGGGAGQGGAVGTYAIDADSLGLCRIGEPG